MASTPMEMEEGTPTLTYAKDTPSTAYAKETPTPMYAKETPTPMYAKETTTPMYAKETTTPMYAKGSSTPAACAKGSSTPAAYAKGSSTPAAYAKETQFEVKEWRAVAAWSWDIRLDNCAICRNHILDCCIECQAKPNSATCRECTIAWGKCNHAFHYHCITRWVKSRPVCPLDFGEWEIQDLGHN